CAKRGMHLLLVALPEPSLDELATELHEKYGVNAQVLGLDMLAAEAPQRVLAWCEENDFPVDKLINNIGVGGRGDFETSPLAALSDMLMLNVQAATLLSRLFVGRLKKHPRSYILNVGSAAGFFHIPHKAVYSATKAYLYSLSRSLRSELKPLGIHVALLAPGGAENKQDPVVHRKMNGWLHRNLHHSPEYIAGKALEGMLKGQKVITPGLLPTIYISLSRLFPSSWVDTVVKKIFRKD
ncbi:MAG TPA: SDR family NAD(P)-dependent oxidoreductase, partial [Anseongella sp.]|nr:SDR family NAD(P)-dependent oxidoreductase [Anseongella sp.]